MTTDIVDKHKAILEGSRPMTDLDPEKDFIIESSWACRRKPIRAIVTLETQRWLQDKKVYRLTALHIPHMKLIESHHIRFSTKGVLSSLTNLNARTTEHLSIIAHMLGLIEAKIELMNWERENEG